MHFKPTFFTYNTQTHWLSVIAMFCVSILFSTGCKKEDADGSAPKIIFTDPHSGDQFFFGDAIPVKASVTDDKNLESIRIQITNAQNQIFLQSILYKNEGTSKTIETTIFVDDIYLESGTYFVRITANDGANESVAFQEIQIYGQPRILQKVYAIRQINNGSTTSIDTFGVNGFSNLLNVPSRYAGGCINSRRQFGMLLDDEQQQFRTFELPDFTPITATNIFVSSFDVFTATKYDEESNEYFVGIVDGRIFKVASGQTLTNFSGSQTNSKVKFLEVTESYIYAITENANATERNMVVYFRSTGAIYHSTPIYFDVKGMVKMSDENQILFIGNETGSLFKFYNNEANAITDVFNFYDQNFVTGIWSGAEGVFYAKHSDGLVRYNNFLESYSVGLNLNPIQVKYEPLSQRIYLITSDGLHILDESAGIELAFYPTTNLVDVWFEYNK